jgi:phage repressor protein C with HTH and peptisase S24 domain
MGAVGRGADGAKRESLLPWQLIVVSGPSMVPALHDGDRVLVRHGAPIRVGDVVLARFRDLPDRLVVKRAERPEDGGWWLASDNEFVGGDSRIHGVADVCARVIVKLRGRDGVWRSPSRVRRAPQA